jgi:hypothetical protein
VGEAAANAATSAASAASGSGRALVRVEGDELLEERHHGAPLVGGQPGRLGVPFRVERLQLGGAAAAAGFQCSMQACEREPVTLEEHAQLLRAVRHFASVSNASLIYGTADSQVACSIAGIRKVWPSASRAFTSHDSKRLTREQHVIH